MYLSKILDAGPMNNIFKILHLEGDGKDTLLIHETIYSEIAFCRIRKVNNQAGFENLLKNEKFDLVISSFGMPNANDFDPLKTAKSLAPGIPYIYVSGGSREDRAYKVLKNGAADYILEDTAVKLVPALLRALNEKEEKARWKQSVKAIKEPENIERAIINALPFQITILDGSGFILSTNIASVNNSIKNAPFPMGLTIGKNYLNECREYGNKYPEAIIFADGIMSVITGYEKSYSQEYSFSENESVKRFLARVNKYEEGGITLIAIVHIDITGIKIADENLRENEKKYRLITENSNDLLATTDEMGVFTYLSPVCERLLGYKQEELIGKNILEYIHPDDQEQIKNKRNRFLEKDDFYDSIYRVKKKEGSYAWFESTSKKVTNKDTGKLDLIISVSRDISERKKTESELQQAKEKAVEMNRLKSNFLANMSHELRTPLIGILGFSDILKSELKESEFQDMIEMINTSGNRLLETLNLILDLSRIEAGRLPMNYAKFDGIKCINEMVEFYKNSAHKKALNLDVDTVLESFEVMLDERMYREIIENLINNALKFTINGGVTVKIDEEENNKEQWIIIKIIDTGIGILKESQEIIFEEFRQVSEGYSRNFEGTGLGLTITKNFIRKMNGSISLESEPNKGSTFTVKLPTNLPRKWKPVQQEQVKDGNTYKKEDEIKLNIFPTGNCTEEILLVEDDTITRALTENYLKKFYSVDTVTDGAEALQKIKLKAYSAILMDINLGKGINGIDTVKEIRNFTNYNDTPIIAFTAYTMKGDKDKFLSSGFTHYLPKPFTKEDIYIVLIDALKK